MGNLKSKRVICVILVIMMTISAVGCAKDKKVDEKGDTSAAQNSSSQNKTESKETELEGETVAHESTEVPFDPEKMKELTKDDVEKYIKLANEKTGYINKTSHGVPACVGGKYAKKIVISKELQEEEKETYEPEIPTEEETTRKNEFEVVLDEFLLNGSDLLEKVPHRIAGKADTLYVDVKIFTEECHPYDANCRMFTYEYDETLKEIYLFSYATEVLMVKLTLESKRFEQLYDSYHYLFAQGTMQCDAPFIEDGVVWIPFLLIADMYDMEINVVYQGDSLLKEDMADYDKYSYVMGE